MSLRDVNLNFSKSRGIKLSRKLKSVGMKEGEGRKLGD